MTIDQILTDETTLVFTNGEVIKGAKEVGDVIMACCRVYTRAYMQAYLKSFTTRALVTGGVIAAGTVTVIVIRNKIKDK